MATNKLAAVCGATGKQGGGTARALLARGGWDVRCLTRNPSSPAAAALVEAGAEVWSESRAAERVWRMGRQGALPPRALGHPPRHVA